MKVTSKTGLLASLKKKMYFKSKKTDVQLKAIAGPAPFVLRPFAGIYNPYPHGCSLLCNHPTDSEAKELLKRAKETWVTEGKSLLLAEDLAALRAGLERLNTSNEVSSSYHIPLPVESVPEELFRRYTETDSRPLTPAPTLVSAYTRASGSRRCMTPDPVPTSEVKKTLLILDLRRSHSQETMSYQGSSVIQEPPEIKIENLPESPETRSPSYTPDSQRKKTERNIQTTSSAKSSKTPSKEDKQEPSITDQMGEEEYFGAEDEDEDENYIRRRGRKRRKRGRDSSRGPFAVQSSIDPETQVATVELDSHDPSARPSLVPTSAGGNTDVMELIEKVKLPKSRDSLDVNSYLDREILKQLRRELNEEVVDNEFNIKRKLALEEALKAVSKDKRDCDELVQLQKELNLSPLNTDLWLSLPRVFTRSSARFELPIDSRSFSTMTPLEYIKDNISVTSARKLLYNCIFNRNKIEQEDDIIEQEYDRKISGKNLSKALNEMMGKDMTNEQRENFKALVGWKDDDVFDFKTFCGLCALCERMLAPEYCPLLPSKKADPPHEIEIADFEALQRKLYGQNPDPRLVKILNAIKDS